MNQNKLSSRAYAIIKSAIVAAVLPVLFIYIMIAKPDYRIMNAMAHVVVPVAHWTGSIITWPVRATGALIENIHDLTELRTENEELRARLDEALSNKSECEVAIRENQKLARELDTVRMQPAGAIIADIMLDNSAFGHNTFLIRRGAADGIEKGQVAVSMDGRLMGVVIDVAAHFARVRALTDSASNIAVRVVGSEVYGFMSGNGSSVPTMGFFSDPEFQPTTGLRLVTSNISGVLPAGIIVGDMINESDVRITPPARATRVMILRFDGNGEYK